MLSMLKIADFRKLWIGQSISVFGTQIVGLAYPVLAVLLLGATEFEMGILNAADNAAFLFFGLFAGVWVDRWRKRDVMIIGDLVRFIAVLSIPILWYINVLEVWHLIAIGFIMGIASLFFDVAYQSYIPILFPEDKIAPANSALETTNQLAHLGGPSIAGFLLTIVKAPILILVDAFSFLGSAFALSLIKDEETPKPKEERRAVKVEILEGLRFVWQQKYIRSISFTTATSNFFSTLAFTLTPLLYLRDLEMSPATFGILGSLSAIGGLVGAMSTTKLIQWFGEGPVIAGSALTSGISACLIPVAINFTGFAQIALLAFSGIVTTFTILSYNITQVSARQRICPQELLGRMNASIRFFVWGVMPIAAVLSGVLGETIGIIPTIWLGSIGVVFAATFVLFSPLSREKFLTSQMKTTEN